MGNTWLDGLELGQPYAGKAASLREVCALLAGEIAVAETAIASMAEPIPATGRCTRCRGSARCWRR